ncbi:hypothetical protein AVEN_100376-1 [Araneus ventricosus]|uniref:Uncharacterized protein n=1 Tax=Araneus ventricosus TaxID=182803 RepID=A0A4Y2LAE3_ARAVE|nr:hypothetical protein AVEN_100376-1 [Araneus ventricosus]
MIFMLYNWCKRDEKVCLFLEAEIYPSFGRTTKNWKPKNSENRRKTKVDNLNYLKSKNAFLQAEIIAMGNSTEELYNLAEYYKNISRSIKANALRKDIKEKASEIKELDSQIFE